MHLFYCCLFTFLLNFSTLTEAHDKHKRGDTSSLPKTPLKTPSKSTDDERITVTVPKEQQERLGLKLAKVEKRKVSHTIRTVGIITIDQTREFHVHTKINGWLEKIYADSVGKRVHKGDPLFSLYSPDLLTTQEEYLSARKLGDTGRSIAKAALDRLRLWDVPTTEIDQLKTSGIAKKSLTFISPADGIITDKKAIQGTYITANMELYQIADLSHLWVIVTLYEADVAIAAVGDNVDIRLPYDSTVHLKGKISYIYPEIEVETRTGKARIEIENRDMRLKPGMFTDVQFSKDLGLVLVIPEDAVIDTGTRKIVFVKSENSHFDPREVTVGTPINHDITILSGLKEGEEVIVNAHFLIDAESKIQAALQKGAVSGGSHAGHSMEGMKK